MILFGVQDGTLSVEGLADDQFDNTDPAAINRILASALDPVPHITKSAIVLDGKKVGMLSVEPHANVPVMALKMMGQDVKEGCIYFRYVGETRTIKPGELRQIIAVREQRAVAEFSRRMMGVATGSQATLDMETGEVKGNAGAFLIDKNLLPQLQFIREGDFSEVKGAPALRLVGDVQPIDREQREKARVIRDAVTPDAVVRNFLKGRRSPSRCSTSMRKRIANANGCRSGTTREKRRSRSTTWLRTFDLRSPRIHRAAILWFIGYGRTKLPSKSIPVSRLRYFSDCSRAEKLCRGMPLKT